MENNEIIEYKEKQFETLDFNPKIKEIILKSDGYFIGYNNKKNKNNFQMPEKKYNNNLLNFLSISYNKPLKISKNSIQKIFKLMNLKFEDNFNFIQLDYFFEEEKNLSQLSLNDNSLSEKNIDNFIEAEISYLKSKKKVNNQKLMNFEISLKTSNKFQKNNLNFLDIYFDEIQNKLNIYNNNYFEEYIYLLIINNKKYFIKKNDLLKVFFLNNINNLKYIQDIYNNKISKEEIIKNKNNINLDNIENNLVLLKNLKNEKIIVNLNDLYKNYKKFINQKQIEIKDYFNNNQIINNLYYYYDETEINPKKSIMKNYLLKKNNLSNNFNFHKNKYSKIKLKNKLNSNNIIDYNLKNKKIYDSNNIINIIENNKQNNDKYLKEKFEENLKLIENIINIDDLPEIYKLNNINNKLDNLVYKENNNSYKYLLTNKKYKKNILNKNNKLCLIYALRNIDKKLILVPYPYLKHLIMQLENCLEISEENIIYDINYNKEIINKEEIEKLYPLTNLGKCLKNEKEENQNIKVYLLNGLIKIIPKKQILLFLDKLKKKEKLNKEEIYYDLDKNKQIINPYLIRPLDNLNYIMDKNEPYILKNLNDNSYYYINNLQKKKLNLLSKNDILKIIKDNNKNKENFVTINKNTIYSIEELKLTLSSYNNENIYIKLKDINNETVLVKKNIFEKFFNLIYFNEIIPEEFTFDNKKIPILENIINLYEIAPSPFLNDKILKDKDNTYIFKNDDYEKTNILSNEFNDFIKIQDLFGNDLFLRKAIIRKILYLKNINENKYIIDCNNKKRLFNLLHYLKKYENNNKNPLMNLKINENNLIVRLGNFFIFKKNYDNIITQYLNNKINLNSFIIINDILTNQKIKLKIENIIKKEKNYNFILLNDIYSNKCIIHKDLIESLINALDEQEIIDVYDYQNNLKKINIKEVIKNSLILNYTPKIHKIQ